MKRYRKFKEETLYRSVFGEVVLEEVLDLSYERHVKVIIIIIIIINIMFFNGVVC